MAPAYDQPTIVPRVGGRDNPMNVASRTTPTAADEEVANILNGAIRRPMKTDKTPKPASSAWNLFSNTRLSFFRRGDGAPAHDETEESQKGKEDDDVEAVGVEEGEDDEQNIGARNEREMPPEDTLSPSVQLQAPFILRRRELRSGSASVLPPPKAITKKRSAAKKTRDQIPIAEIPEQDDVSDDESVQRLVSAQTTGASRNPSSSLVHKTNHPPKSSAKRKRPEARSDPYDLPEDDSSEESRKLARPAKKRARIIAKTPIDMRNPSRTTRTRSRKLPESSVLRSVEVVLPVKSAESTLPKKRGRPPAAKSVAPPVRKSKVTKDQGGDNQEDEESLFIPETQFPEAQEDMEQEAEDYTILEDHSNDEEEEAAEDGGVTEILIAPSPIKPLRQEAIQVPRRITSRVPSQVSSQVAGRGPPTRPPDQASSQARSRPVSKGAATIKQIFAPPAERARRHLDDDSSEDESLVGMNERSYESEDDNSDDSDAIFKIATLAKMYKTALQVGKSWIAERNEFAVKEPLSKPTTDNGTELFAVVKSLIMSYEEGDFALSETKVAIDRELCDLREAIEKVHMDVLNQPERNEKSQEVLKDLYFYILPQLVHTMLLAAKAYTLSKNIEQTPLKELSKLSRMLKDLAEDTLRHSSMPRTDGTKATRSNYRFSKPMQSINPEIRALCASLVAELSYRRQDKKRKERERRKELAAKARKEQAERDVRTQRARAEDLQRLQKESLRRAMANPIVNKLATAELNKTLMPSSQARSSSKTYGRPRFPSSSPPAEENLNYDTDLPAGDEEEGEFEDDPEPERVSVFGQNNNLQERGPQPWTNSERATFIEIMKNNNGPYKYEQIATELDRSMDDVIMMAKDLQAVMDHAHDEGKMTTEGDWWTWHIWNPRPESQV